MKAGIVALYATKATFIAIVGRDRHHLEDVELS